MEVEDNNNISVLYKTHHICHGHCILPSSRKKEKENLGHGASVSLPHLW